MAPNYRDCHQVIPSPRKRATSNVFFAPKVYESPKQSEVFCDIKNKKWRLGRCIGVGAFGDIFIASDDLSKNVSNDAHFVVKMEPQSNGPLFVEMNFYLRVGQEELIEEWKQKKKLKALGMPTMLGFGFHTIKNEAYRCIVLPRYGENVHNLFIKNGKRFHVKTAFTIASHTLNIIEYIHSRGYLHLDIKGLNMLIGNGNGSAPLYLIDFGLSTKYRIRGRHKEQSEDRRMAETGTLEYSSRKSHIGVMSRRDDLESLGFNLVHWLSGWLPWLQDLDKPETVLEMKRVAMSNVKAFLTNVFHPQQPPEALVNYLDYVNQLEFETRPDYDYCQTLFSQAIVKQGYAPDQIISFDSHAKLKKTKKRKAEEENNLSLKKFKPKHLNAHQRRPCTTQNLNSIEMRVTRTQAENGIKLRSKRDFDWATILAGDPEREVKEKQKKEKIKQQLDTPENEQIEEDDSLLNPTPQMLAVMNKKKKSGSSDRSSLKQSGSFASYLTPAMEEVMNRRNKMPKACPSPKFLRSSKRKLAQLSNDGIIACGKF